MVNYSQAALDATFAALADPTRRAILARLARGESSVGDLARPFRMSLPAVSKHLKALEEARLVGRRRLGRTHLIHLEARRLREAAEWIRRHEEFWRSRLDALQAYLERGGGREER